MKSGKAMMIFALLCHKPTSARIRLWEDITLKDRTLMEHINRIELQGRVGSVRMNTAGSTKVANFTMATDYLYKGRDGAAVSETTWHNVTAWAGKGIPDLALITKGIPVNVIGRVREVRYKSAEGVEKVFHEVIAHKITLVDDNENSE